MRIILRLLFVFAITLGTASATLPLTEIPAGPARSCCAGLMDSPGHCPPQPAHGMNGSCCSTPSCVHLFLQTRELPLKPDSIDFAWSDFSERETTRPTRPAVPPPRA